MLPVDTHTLGPFAASHMTTSRFRHSSQIQILFSFIILLTRGLLLNMIRVAHPVAAAPSQAAPLSTPIIDETPSERCKRVWREADAVCFDVDSTVCQDEAIDELAAYLGVGEAVANVTRSAMNGNARFRWV